MSNTETETNLEHTFQARFYAAIKKFLVKKGYMSQTEAKGPEEWTLVNNASWTAYASNVYGLNNAPVPWNEDSIPAPLLEDTDFEWGTAEAPADESVEETTSQEDTVESHQAPALEEALQEEQDKADADAAPKDTVFKVNTEAGK